MVSGPEEFEELAKEIRDLLKENEKFLKRVLEEDFEPEETDEDEDSSEDFEEL